MADLAPDIPFGESRTYINGTSSSAVTYTIKGDYKCEVEGSIDLGTASVTRKSDETGATAVPLLSLDSSYLSGVHGRFPLRSGDEVVLTLGSGTGHVGLRLLHKDDG